MLQSSGYRDNPNSMIAMEIPELQRGKGASAVPLAAAAESVTKNKTHKKEKTGKAATTEDTQPQSIPHRNVKKKTTLPLPASLAMVPHRHRYMTTHHLSVEALLAGMGRISSDIYVASLLKIYEEEDDVALRALQRAYKGDLFGGGGESSDSDEDYQGKKSPTLLAPRRGGGTSSGGSEDVTNSKRHSSSVASNAARGSSVAAGSPLLAGSSEGGANFLSPKGAYGQQKEYRSSSSGGRNMSKDSTSNERTEGLSINVPGVFGKMMTEEGNKQKQKSSFQGGEGGGRRVRMESKHRKSSAAANKRRTSSFRKVQKSEVDLEKLDKEVLESCGILDFASVRLIPWRCVFREWVHCFQEELATFAGKRGDTLIELFLTRVESATSGRQMHVHRPIKAGGEVGKAIGKIANHDDAEDEDEAESAIPHAEVDKDSVSESAAAAPGDQGLSPRTKGLVEEAKKEAAAVKEKQRRLAAKRFPHVLTVASALYVMEKHILPMFDPFLGDLAQQALNELMKAAFVQGHSSSGAKKNASNNEQRNDLQKSDELPLISSQSDLSSSVSSMTARLAAAMGGGDAAEKHKQQQLLYASLDMRDDASRYVRETHLEQVQNVLKLFFILRDRWEQHAIVVERQDNILNSTILKWQEQTSHRMFLAWHTYTKRSIKLRNRYRTVLLSLSSTAVTCRSIRLWASYAHDTLAKSNHEKHEKTEEQIAHGQQLAMFQSLTALVRQKQIKMVMVEQGEAANRKLIEKASFLETTANELLAKHASIVDAFFNAMEKILPPPIDPIQAARRRTILEQNTAFFLDADEAKRRVLVWIADLAAADGLICGKKMYQLLVPLANETKSRFTSGLLARSTHLLPVMRMLLTILAPPRGSGLLQPMAGDSAGKKKLRFSEHNPELLGSSKRMSLHHQHAQLTSGSLPHGEQDHVIEGEAEVDTLKRRISRRASKLSSLGGFRAFSEEDTIGENSSFASSSEPFSSQQRSLFPSDYNPDNDPERQQQIDHLLTPLRECSTLNMFSNYLLLLINKLVQHTTPKAHGGSGHAAVSGAVKLFMPTMTKHVSRRNDVFREFMLAFLYFTQHSYSCAFFHSVQGPNAAARRRSHQQLEMLDSLGGGGGTTLAGAKSRSKSIRFVAEASAPVVSGAPSVTMSSSQASFARKGTVFAPKPLTPAQRWNAVVDAGIPTSGSDIRNSWQERITQRQVCGDASNVFLGLKAYDETLSRVINQHFSGGDVTLESRRVYELFCSASPYSAFATVIPTDFLAAKMKIVFGRESSFWRPMTSSRVIQSAEDMEEYITTVSSASSLSPLELCDKLYRAADDYDHFISSLTSEETTDALEQHLPDLSLIFSLYASGEPPFHVITKESWIGLNSAWLDSLYNQQQAETVFDIIVSRNSKEGGVEDRRKEIMNDEQLVSSLSPSSPLGGSSASDSKKNVHELLTYQSLLASMAPSASTLVGMDMDSFCQGLCVVMQFKIPSPFLPVESKAHQFICNWLIPMVGAKVKSARRRSSVGAGVLAPPETKLQFPIPMDVTEWRKQQEELRAQRDAKAGGAAQQRVNSSTGEGKKTDSSSPNASSPNNQRKSRGNRKGSMAFESSIGSYEDDQDEQPPSPSPADPKERSLHSPSEGLQKKKSVRFGELPM